MTLSYERPCYYRARPVNRQRGRLTLSPPPRFTLRPSTNFPLPTQSGRASAFAKLMICQIFACVLVIGVPRLGSLVSSRLSAGNQIVGYNHHLGVPSRVKQDPTKSNGLDVPRKPPSMTEKKHFRHTSHTVRLGRNAAPDSDAPPLCFWRWVGREIPGLPGVQTVSRAPLMILRPGNFQIWGFVSSA